MNTTLTSLGASTRLDDEKVRSSSTSATPGSSKAVLAALRALQDKIRRLEAERAQAMDECTHLKNQIRSAEVEAEHIKQRDTLNSQRSLLEAKAAFDRLATEKTNLQMQCSELHEKNKQSERNMDNMRSRIFALEQERDSLLVKQDELNERQQEAEIELEKHQQNERDLTERLTSRTQRGEDNTTLDASRVQTAEGELARVIEEKDSYEAKLSELDGVVSQLLRVNEQLVSQLQGKYLPGNFARSPAAMKKVQTKGKKLLKKDKKSVPKTKPTSRLGLSTASIRARSKPVGSDTLDGEYLKELHKIYVSMSHDLIGNDVPVSRRLKKTNLSSKSVCDEPVPKKKIKVKTRLSKRRTDKNKCEDGKKGDREKEKDTTDRKKTKTLKIPTTRRLDMETEVEEFEREALAYDMEKSRIEEEKDDELTEVISNLEDEFASLTSQYQGLLNGVNSGDDDDPVKSTRDLVDVIQQMHIKGDKLRALRSPPGKTKT